MKTCSKCKTDKELIGYSIRKDSKDGRRGVCNKCRATEHRDKYSKNYEAKRIRPKGWREQYRAKMNTQYGIKHKYGLTPEDYGKLMSKAGNKCEICGRLASETYCLVVDHDHNTGKVRGVLCNTCNGILGHYEKGIRAMKDDGKYFKTEAADNYLSKQSV